MYNSIYMLMVGEKDPDPVWGINQLNQDLCDSNVCTELPAEVPGWTGSAAMQVHLILSISTRVK